MGGIYTYMYMHSIWTYVCVLCTGMCMWKSEEVTDILVCLHFSFERDFLTESEATPAASKPDNCPVSTLYSAMVTGAVPSCPDFFFFCECSDVNSGPHTHTAISLAELFPHPQSQWVFSASSVSELLLHFGLPQSFSDFCLVLWPGLGFVPLGSCVALGWPCLSVVDQYAHLAYRDDVFQSSSHGLTELLKW